MSLSEGLFASSGATNAATEALAGRLADALPRVIREGVGDPGVGADLVAAMAAMLGPRAALIDAVGTVFDPHMTPEALLPWLASWFGWGWLFEAPDDPRRRLALAEAFRPVQHGCAT